MANYYKVLNVSPRASKREIKSAYRQLARKMHPDLNGGTPKATEDFALLAKAYEVLSSPKARAQYDKQAAASNGSIHSSDSVIFSDNPHAQKLRQMAIEYRYNQIIDRIMDAERLEALALQKAVFPTVALFVSTFFVGILRPAFWANAGTVGKIILLTLFVIGVLHMVKRLYAAFTKYTYDSEQLHDSILEEDEPEEKPYSRITAGIFLVVGTAACFGLGFLAGNYLETSLTSVMPSVFSPTLRPEFIFYPPIFVLLVDLMHIIAAKLEN